jgi:hypothetical protein
MSQIVNTSFYSFREFKDTKKRPNYGPQHISYYIIPICEHIKNHYKSNIPRQPLKPSKNNKETKS